MKSISLASFVTLTGLLFSDHGIAATFSSFFDIMYPSEKSTIIEVVNDSEKYAHVFSVDVFEIKSPIDRTPVSSLSPNTVTFTPATQIVKPGASAKVKFLYNGPADNKERYFAIRWKDATLKRNSKTELAASEKAGHVFMSTSIITTLIINPRDSNITVEYNKGQVINNGNAMVDLFVNGTCNETNKPCSYSTPILPNQRLDLKEFKYDKDFNIGYWTSESATKSVDTSS